MISVIIATRNRAALLASTLQALSVQASADGPFEIVVVDNGSFDNTAEVVEAAARRGIPLLYLYEPESGKSHALNRAIGRARGDIIALTDDDVLPSEGWLAALARALQETGADYAVGRILPLWEAAPPAWMSVDLYGVLAVPDGGERRLLISRGTNDHIMPLGANMAVRRRVLEVIGGWNPDLGKLQGTLRTGEDHEFFLRMLEAGFLGVYEPEASVRHRVPADRLRLEYFHRWFSDNGTIEAGLEGDHPTTTRYLLNVPRYLWRQALHDFTALLVAAVSRNSKRTVAARMRLAWFRGYLRGRWHLRGTHSPVLRTTHSTVFPPS